jgi:hypothetical protein
LRGPHRHRIHGVERVLLAWVHLNLNILKIIIVYENNCQVPPDIFFMREESKNFGKWIWKFYSGVRDPVCPQGGGKKNQVQRNRKDGL